MESCMKYRNNTKMESEPMISVSIMFEILRRALMPFYTNKHVIITEEGDGEQTRKVVVELDFIQRAIAETYVERWGEAKDLEKALEDQDEVTRPNKDMGYGLITYR